MKYVLLICGDETLEFPPDKQEAIGRATQAWIDGTGTARLTGHRLAPTTDATTVRRRSGEVLIADGPFAETKEQVGGFDIIECADLDEAIAIAAKHPVAEFGSIEIRPFWPSEY